MPAFHEIQFPGKISYGSTGGPQRLTQIVGLKSGFEERNQIWAHSRRKYNAGIGVQKLGGTPQAIQAVLAFWEARSGPLYGFRWKDWTDFTSHNGGWRVSAAFDDQAIGVGDGAQTEFQLVKNYLDNAGGYSRPIKKPVAGTVLIGLGGVAQGSGWTVDTTTGIVTFDAAPGNGVQITAGFEFDVPVRFDADELELSVDAFDAASVPAIDVIEIRV